MKITEEMKKAALEDFEQMIRFIELSRPSTQQYMSDFLPKSAIETIRALLQPGDAVAVEDPGYAFSWPAFRFAGVKLVPVPVDRAGRDVAHGL